MTTIPREFIDLLLSKIDIVELINAQLPLRKKSANNYFACCPFHNEKSASFSVSQVKQFYYCFGCGAHGNAIDFLMQQDRLAFPEAIEALAKLTGMEVPRNHNTSTVKKDDTLPELYDFMHEVTATYYKSMKQSERAIQYLKQRGISGQVAQQFCLGYAPSQWDYLYEIYGKIPGGEKKLTDAGLIVQKEKGRIYDRFRDRIIFPIHDYRGRIIGFGGRILDQGEPKYLNSPDTILFQKGRELYGLHHALKANRNLERVVIVEGYMDVIALFQHEITYAVATQGTATTTQQLQRLFRYTNEIIFCFDGDNAGKTAAWRALQVLFPLLSDQIQARFLFLPENEDPDSLIRKEGKQAFEQALSQAQSLSAFFFQTLAKQRDFNTIEGRAGFAADALVYIKQLPSSILQQILTEELKQRARVDLPVPNTSAPSPPQTTSKPPISPSQQQTYSPIRLALALLIQMPSLAEFWTPPVPLTQSNRVKQLELIEQVVDIIKKSPSITTGQLIEYWRDTPTEKLITQLAHYPHSLPETGIKQEFLGIIRQLSVQLLEEAIQSLRSKAANDLLSLAEKKELLDYIVQKKNLS